MIPRKAPYYIICYYDTEHMPGIALLQIRFPRKGSGSAVRAGKANRRSVSIVSAQPTWSQKCPQKALPDKVEIISFKIGPYVS